MAVERNRSSSKSSVLIKNQAFVHQRGSFLFAMDDDNPPPRIRLWFIKYKHATTFGPSQKAERKRFLRWNLDADFHSNRDRVQFMKNGDVTLIHLIKETSKGNSTLVNPPIFPEIVLMRDCHPQSVTPGQTQKGENAKVGYQECVRN